MVLGQKGDVDDSRKIVEDPMAGEGAATASTESVRKGKERAATGALDTNDAPQM